MSRSIPKKRGIVKPAKGKKPARYTQKVDSLGRRYTTDKQSGKRVSNELWEREQAKARPKAKAKSKSKAKAKATKPSLGWGTPRNYVYPTEPSASIPRNIFDVWDIPNAEWKREQESASPRITPLSEQVWEPEEWVDDDEDLFTIEKEEREAELKFRAAKAERDRELLQNAVEFIPPSRIKGFSESILERAARYPKVKRALDKASAWADLERQVVIEEANKPTKDEHIRSRFLFAIEQDEDIESVVGDLADMFEEEVHDIYEIYFSPEVA